MMRLSLAVALAAAVILATEVTPTSETWLVIVAAVFLMCMLSGIIWLLSPKFWREVTTVRFWIVLAALVLGSLATLKLR